MIVVNFIQWLIGIFYPQLTEAERDAAAFISNSKVMNECRQSMQRPQIAVMSSYEGEKK